MKNLTFILCIMSLALMSCGQKKDFQPEMVESSIKIEGLDADTNLFIEEQVKKLKQLATEETIIQAILASNEKNKGLTTAEINRLDQNWRNNNNMENSLIKELISNECARFLEIFDLKNPQLIELFVMDNRGLLVGTINITSDYNQGDEAKWSEVFGKDQIWCGQLEYDESTLSHGVQVSVPVKDIGAICATISLKNRYSIQ